MWKFTVLAVLAISASRHVVAVCNQCKNGFACVSETEFQLCFSDQPDTNRTYSCPGRNEVCSHYGQICMPKDAAGVVPACRGMQNCVCDEMLDFLFVCTSRTTFNMCFNQTYSTQRGRCPQNQLCDVEKGKNGEIPCSNKCLDDVPDALICDFQEPVDGSTPVTPTGTPSTVTPPPTTVVITPIPPNTANEFCRNQTVAGRFSYPNDSVCTSYIYCYWGSTDVLLGRNTPCPTGRYFNRDTRNCQTTKPSWCI